TKTKPVPPQKFHRFVRGRGATKFAALLVSVWRQLAKMAMSAAAPARHGNLVCANAEWVMSASTTAHSCNEGGIMVARVMRRSAVLAIGAATLAAASARADSPQVTLALPSVNISFTALYLAEDLHLWADQGLDVKTIVIPGVGTNNAVINGSVQF